MALQSGSNDILKPPDLVDDMSEEEDPDECVAMTPKEQKQHKKQLIQKRNQLAKQNPIDLQNDDDDCDSKSIDNDIIFTKEIDSQHLQRIKSILLKLSKVNVKEAQITNKIQFIASLSIYLI